MSDLSSRCCPGGVSIGCVVRRRKRSSVLGSETTMSLGLRLARRSASAVGLGVDSLEVVEAIGACCCELDMRGGVARPSGIPIGWICWRGAPFRFRCCKSIGSSEMRAEPNDGGGGIGLLSNGYPCGDCCAIGAIGGGVPRVWPCTPTGGTICCCGAPVGCVRSFSSGSPMDPMVKLESRRLLNGAIV